MLSLAPMTKVTWSAQLYSTLLLLQPPPPTHCAKLPPSDARNGSHRQIKGTVLTLLALPTRGIQERWQARPTYVMQVPTLGRSVFKIYDGTVPSFSVHPEELQESTKQKLNDRGYFYANSNAGLGWTDRANREAFYRWRIVPRMLVDTNTRDLTSECWLIWNT